MTGSTQDRRLTCNRLFRELIARSQQGFSGRLDIEPATGKGWSIFMEEGCMVWATGGPHPLRRWRRQLLLVTGRRPEIAHMRAAITRPLWDYSELQQLAERVLSPLQVNAIARGVLDEILFDVVQAFEMPVAAKNIKHNQPVLPLLPLSRLDGINDLLEIVPNSGRLGGESPVNGARMPSAFALQKETQAAWEQWACLGLLDVSPNSAPTIEDPQSLRNQTSSNAYKNLVALLNGNRTFRDIALKMKRDRDQLGVGCALAPYIRRGWIGLRAVGDLLTEAPRAAEAPRMLRA